MILHGIWNGIYEIVFTGVKSWKPHVWFKRFLRDFLIVWSTGVNRRRQLWQQIQKQSIFTMRKYPIDVQDNIQTRPPGAHSYHTASFGGGEGMEERDTWRLASTVSGPRMIKFRANFLDTLLLPNISCMTTELPPHQQHRKYFRFPFQVKNTGTIQIWLYSVGSTTSKTTLHVAILLEVDMNFARLAFRTFYG